MIKTATGPIKLFLEIFGFRGIAAPWGVMYLLPGSEWDMRLIRHERMHFQQMARDGTIRFLLRYAWYSLRHGYYNNPYEIEARRAEDER